MTTDALTTHVVTTPAAPPRAGVTRRMLRDPLTAGALGVFALVVVVSVFAPLIAPFDPNHVVPAIARSGPGSDHLLGGDGAGRDVLSRLLYGGRSTLLGALVTLAVAILAGVPAGLLAGYYGKAYDAVLSWLSNTLIAIPGLVILLSATAAVGGRTLPIMALFGVLLAPSFFRLVRTAVMGVRDELYVDAARISGLGDLRIVGRHVFPVVRAPIVIQAAIGSGIAVLTQTGLQFLGVLDPSDISWGQMLADAFTNIYAAPTLVIWPGLAIAVTVAALALAGNGLRDALTDRPKVTARTVARDAAQARTDPEPPARAEAPDPAVLLRVEGLTLTYPTPEGPHAVVTDVSLSVRRGEVLGLVGESGSGKTQTAFAVLGLLPADATVAAGTVSFDGVTLTGSGGTAHTALRGRRIAYVPQEPMSNLDPAFTVGHQLVEPIRVCLGLSRAAAKARALELLARVGIADPARTFAAYPHEISGGMAQRVLIAGAVSCDPDLLIADEPTTALDVTVQAEVLDLLRDLREERDMTVLLVTHDFGVVADLCDRVAVMRAGRIVEVQDTAGVFAAPGDPYTRTLLESTLEGAPLRAPLTAPLTVPGKASR
ncbi:dipeptide/oligopeptide/nickel ABC transporter permease/ATP-binding protein [Streptomyces liangshanensis]|uniref:dipeptide/oligopeptide/nickel ABC transporter permease/ATP-binding protein n=1 Tax=Streptomyces liangshanensis TaxID=2717324 RepID=UPI0036DA84D3